MTGKDISKKRSVNIRYFLGFERMVRFAVENFRRIGLEAVIYRAPQSIWKGGSWERTAITAGIANRQFEYDHEYDQALFYDKRYVNHRLENYRTRWKGEGAGGGARRPRRDRRLRRDAL